MSSGNLTTKGPKSAHAIAFALGRLSRAFRGVLHLALLSNDAPSKPVRHRGHDLSSQAANFELPDHGRQAIGS